MSENRLQLSTKQALIFLGIMILIPVGFIGLIAKASPENNGGAANVLGRKETSNSQAEVTGNSPVAVNDGFLGERGEALRAEGDKVYIEEAKVSDGNMRSFNYYSKKAGKNIYFFVVKASDGTYRAAADACEVCYDSKKGFRQVGNQIRCENCRTMYSKDQIALQKGGCNPRPIDKDVKVANGRLAISLADIEKTADLF